MKDQSKDKKPLITLKSVRKASNEEMEVKVPGEKGITLAKWTVGVSHFPEMGGKARAFFPTHNFDIIKHHREYVYKSFIVWEFTNERVIKMIKTTEKDFKECRKNWLNSELKEISHLIELPSMTRSDQIELEKYREYINDELNPQNDTIKGITSKIKKPCKSEMRARAFCFLLLQQAGMEPRVIGKNELISLVNKRFPKPISGYKELSGKTVYEEINKGLNLMGSIPDSHLNKSEKGKVIKWRDKYKSDYEYGLKLFNDFKST